MERRHQGRQIFRFAESHDASTLCRRRRKRFAHLHNTLHMLRDADAFLYVFDALNEALGFRFGGVVYNLPEEIYAGYGPSDEAGFKACSRADDLIVRNTRPIVPYKYGDKKHAYGVSDTNLEGDLSQSDARFFYYCNRDEIWLSNEVKTRIGNRHPFARVEFQERQGARSKGPGRPMVGYVTYMPQVSERLPTPVLNVFSLDGTSCLLWTYVLATFAPDILKDVVASPAPRLLVGRFDVKFPDRRIEDLSELTYTPHEIVLDRTLSPDAPPGWPLR